MSQSLSPAAQAVLDAYKAASDGCYINGEWIQDHAVQVAAALRAAADQVVEEVSPVEALLAIAAELEGATCDPLEPQDLSHLSDEEFHALAPQGFHGV